MKRKIIHWVVKSMNSKGLLMAGALILMLVFAGKAHALIINPADYGFGPDDGSELFNHCDCATAWEGYDINQTGGTEFGFFFSADPTNLITIFDKNDEGKLQNPPKARINFITGIVTDLDDGTQQSSFDNSLNGPIGFYLIPDNIHTLYTVGSMNPWGDLAQTYRHSTDTDRYLLRFENPFNQDMTLAYEVVKGITPIPEPSTLTLVGLGILLVGVFSIKSLVSKTTG